MNNSNINQPVVGVLMVTYNHEKYIEQAIESVMAQITDFSYKLFIGEDRSTDNTRDICIKMKQKYGDKIELYLNEGNLGSSLNCYNLLQNIINAEVTFIAILDGDDYWIDKNKIKKQVAILEANSDCAICFTGINVLIEETGIISRNVGDYSVPPRVNCNTFLGEGSLINTCTLLFRADALPRLLPEWFSKTLKQDWAIAAMVIYKGDAFFLPEVTAVYRIHKRGLIKSTSQIRMEENSIVLLREICKYFYPDYQELLGNVISWKYFNLAFIYWDQCLWRGFFRNLHKALENGEKKSIGWYWYTLKTILKRSYRLILTR